MNRHEIQNQPAYSPSEAARYLKLPVATLRSWVAGRRYARAGGIARFQPLIHPPQRKPPLLSFWNLVEAHVLRSLRTEHGVSLKALREALRYAEGRLGIERLLLREELRTHGGQVFLDRYGELTNLSASGQIAIRHMLEEHLARIEWDARRFPIRLYPFMGRTSSSGNRPIAIDPQISFGRPIVVRAGVTTAVIAERIDAGESVQSIAADYALTEPEIREAVFYERAA